MKFTELFAKPGLGREVKGAEAINHKLLVKGAFIDQLMAGAYTYLPLGIKVLKKIENIVRDEMVKAGGQEILMPALHPKEIWEKTGRWENMDDLFRFTSHYSKKEFALGPTHEEVLSPLTRKFAYSYKDFPFAVFQIQTKFRDEKRAKSGILRGREFLMKDYYSFHTTEADLTAYYEKMKAVYSEVLKRIGLDKLTYLTYASGGTFSKFSHEYQTITPAGEDSIFICNKCNIAVNEEIMEELDKKCPQCGNKELKKEKAIEVGNIFELKDKFTKPFNVFFVDNDGKEKPVLMGCYGIGITRAMGAIVEICHDDKGIVWPDTVAPYRIHLVNLGKTEEQTEKIYNELIKAGKEVIWDDRDVTAGTKLADADLIGIPLRIVVSDKTLEKESVELKERSKKETELVRLDGLIKSL